MTAAKHTMGPNPKHVEVRGREYAVYFHIVTGAPCTVEVHKAHHQTQRLNINGPTARAAIAAATGASE